MAAATPANPDQPSLYVTTWMLPERIEAAVRCGQPEVGAAALRTFVDTANPADTDWGLGVEARGRALLAAGREAEDCYR